MPEEEFSKAKEDCFIRVEGVHTIKELQEFIGRKMVEDLDVRKGLPYRLYFISDFNKEYQAS
jgi:hypothetical protein